MIQTNFDETELTIFDTETTGLEAESGDRIVELAAVRYKAGKPVASFQTLINPHRPVSEAAFQVNGISSEMLESAPEMKSVMPQFLGFIQNSILCSYNAGFDMAFLNSELRILGGSFPEDMAVVDILRMARRLLPGLERYALWFVAERLGIKTQQKHRALADVELTFQVFSALHKIFASKGSFGLSHFISLFGLNSSLLEDITATKVAKIQEALDLGVNLKIKYFSSSAQISEREVLPRQIKQDKDRSYLIGYCCLRNEERSFRIDSILHVEIV